MGSIVLVSAACSESDLRDTAVVSGYPSRALWVTSASTWPDPLAPPPVLADQRWMPQKGSPGGADSFGVPPPRLLVPVRGVRVEDLVDSFGAARGSRLHRGLDIMAPRGTEVLASVDGWVWRMQWDQRGGRILFLLDSSHEYLLLYAHLDGYATGLSEGQSVRRGEVLGYVGRTGNVSGSSHLHLQIGQIRSLDRWWEEEWLNPYPLFMAPRAE